VRAGSKLEVAKRTGEKRLSIELLSCAIVDSWDFRFGVFEAVNPTTKGGPMVVASLDFGDARGEVPTEATASRNSNFETSWASLLLVGL